MGLNYSRDRLCLLQFSNSDGEVFLIKFNDKNYNCPNLKKLLLNENQLKIFHFARFDLAIIHYYLGVSLTNIFCTRTASKLVRTYTDAHSLKELCRELLGVQISKQQQSSDWGNSNLTHDQQAYAAKDVLYLHKLKDILTIMLEREDRLILAKKIFEFLPIRSELDIKGWDNIDIFAH